MSTDNTVHYSSIVSFRSNTWQCTSCLVLSHSTCDNFDNDLVTVHTLHMPLLKYQNRFLPNYIVYIPALWLSEKEFNAIQRQQTCRKNRNFVSVNILVGNLDIIGLLTPLNSCPSKPLVTHETSLSTLGYKTCGPLLQTESSSGSGWYVGRNTSTWVQLSP
jgi:hypothetical protein